MNGTRRTAPILARLGSWARAWRLEPWDVGPYRSMSRWYQVTEPLVVIFLVAAAAAAAALAEPSWRPLQQHSIIAVIVITGLLSLLNFQTSDTHGTSPAMVALVALLISGSTPDALACALTWCLVSPLRKPLPVHLIVGNVAFLGAAAIVGTSIRQLIWTGDPVTAEWVVAGFCGASMYFLANAPVYLTFRDVATDGPMEWMRAWLRDASGEVFELMPIAFAVAAGLGWPHWPALLLLAVPGLASYYTFALLSTVMSAQDEANRDPLTGIANRRRLDSELATTSDALHASNGHAWIMLLDLDHFKQLNDSFGHSVGDEALRLAASALRRSIRSNDFCGRFGGEEFVVIVRDAPREAVIVVAERIRSNIEVSLAHLSGSASVGVALLTRDDDAHAVLEVADGALYRAKELGRNRVVFADAPEAEPAMAAQ